MGSAVLAAAVVFGTVIRGFGASASQQITPEGYPVVRVTVEADRCHPDQAELASGFVAFAVTSLQPVQVQIARGMAGEDPEAGLLGGPGPVGLDGQMADEPQTIVRLEKNTRYTLTCLRLDGQEIGRSELIVSDADNGTAAPVAIGTVTLTDEGVRIEPQAVTGDRHFFSISNQASAARGLAIVSYRPELSPLDNVTFLSAFVASTGPRIDEPLGVVGADVDRVLESGVQFVPPASRSPVEAWLIVDLATGLYEAYAVEGVSAPTLSFSAYLAVCPGPVEAGGDRCQGGA